MGRKLRIEYYGAVYHVIQRGQFVDDEDKMMILQIFGEVKETVEYNLLAYCILDDSYHIVIKTLNIPLSNIMQRINTRYSKYFNNKYSGTSSPLRGRYKGIIIGHDDYLIQLINYVHNKPVYNDVVNNMEEYKWSSDFLYRINMDSIVDIDYLFSHLSTDREISIKNYIDGMELSNEDRVNIRGKYENVDTIGDDKRIGLDEILKSICSDEKDYELIKGRSKKNYLIRIKRDYAIFSKKSGYTNMEIAKNIGVSDRTVRDYLKVKVKS